VLRVGGTKRLDSTGVHAGSARPDTHWPVPRRSRGTCAGSHCEWSRRALGPRHRQQPARILEIAGRLSDAQRVGAAPLPNALPVGDRLEAVCEQQLTGLSRRPGGPYCSPHSTARVPRNGVIGAGAGGGGPWGRIGRGPGPGRTRASGRGDRLPPSAAAYVGAGVRDFGGAAVGTSRTGRGAELAGSFGTREER
jgi:hypothetical protein